MSTAHLVHALLFCLYVHGRDFTCKGHVGFSGFPVTGNGIFSYSSILSHVLVTNKMGSGLDEWVYLLLIQTTSNYT
jgi:hypothetical protein